MLKSVIALMSKQRGRALARINYPYLNRWADPLFIGVPRGLRCSGDPIGLNSEYSRRVDMLQVHRHRDEYSVSLAKRREPATGQAQQQVVSGVRWWMWSIVSGYCCQSVRGGMTQAVRDPQSKCAQ
ncbi:hypothetical protein TIFTF001_037649 [Ficus carica]|uniref:Uncharacterized protein n=1 Tax=Ficus carica TaxID=3494 RepID=A0AA88E6F1_FICCA|nr:hypothetical protein TIFTF001_037649 [Ficus carica]